MHRAALAKLDIAGLIIKLQKNKKQGILIPGTICTMQTNIFSIGRYPKETRGSLFNNLNFKASSEQPAIYESQKETSLS